MPFMAMLATVLGLLFLVFSFLLLRGRPVSLSSRAMLLVMLLSFMGPALPMAADALKGNLDPADGWFALLMPLMCLLLLWFMRKALGNVVLFNVDEDMVYESVFAVLAEMGMEYKEFRGRIRLGSPETEIRISTQGHMATALVVLPSTWRGEFASAFLSELRADLAGRPGHAKRLTGVVHLLCGLFMLACGVFLFCAEARLDGGPPRSAPPGQVPGGAVQLVDRPVRVGPVTAGLRDIELPANPTREELRDYVRSILALSEGQSSFSSQDPQVARLTEVGPEHLDVLIDELGQFVMGDFHLLCAISELADERHKGLILGALPNQPDLAEIVLERDWVKDAEDVLVARLRARPCFLPTEWISAVAQLQRPDTYDDLIAYFESGPNKSWTYSAIETLPGIDLEAAVNAAWAECSTDDDWEASSMAPIAARHGNLDALEYLVGELSRTPTYWDTQDNARRELQRLTGVRGTDDDIRRWFEENRDRLAFDMGRGRYFAAEE
jgi:hypothetical protein